VQRNRVEPIVLVLLATIAIGLAWNQFGMNRRLVLDGSSNVTVRAIDDGSSGGKTNSSVHREGSKSNGRDRVELNIGGRHHISLPSLDAEISDLESSDSASHFHDSRWG
jgi:hypothetical protein